ncbi:hypothetical protein SAG0176_10755 [Streptococcus agalactiae LDS 623]|nr:hypothetical protein SAG0181_09730 [Streptococcus agalactiae LDS 628]EPX17128.1 hypothetical protein SAG0176_10755 [Streptococcus agalactiae LDS 623]
MTRKNIAVIRLRGIESLLLPINHAVLVTNPAKICFACPMGRELIKIGGC